MKKIICFLIVFLFSTVVLGLVVSAEEGDGAIENRYFTYMNEDGSWHEWIGCTLENETILNTVNLKVGQPVKCKLKFFPYDQGSLVFYLYHPGTIIKYDVIEGSQFDEYIRFQIRNNTDISPNEGHILSKVNDTIEYVWILVPNENWTNGHAAINLCYSAGFFNGDIVDENLGFAYPYILNEEWTGPSYDEIKDSDLDTSNNNNEGNQEDIDNNNNGSPGFEFIAVFMVLFSLTIYSRYKKRK